MVRILLVISFLVICAQALADTTPEPADCRIPAKWENEVHNGANPRAALRLLICYERLKKTEEQPELRKQLATAYAQYVLGNDPSQSLRPEETGRGEFYSAIQVMTREELTPETIGFTSKQIRQRVISLLKAQIKRDGGLPSDLNETMRRFHFTPADLGVTPKQMREYGLLK